MKALQQLAKIFNERTNELIATIIGPSDESAPRVQEASMYHNYKAPSVHKLTQWTYQWHTCNNIPGAIPVTNNPANAVPSGSNNTFTL